ncbi:MAG: MATE family efflux transporter [Candidatus Hinthialibacter antarcticus]|nr:MATE family efflux transporter [Candidatus Hinthialibacter antarcticus]
MLNRWFDPTLLRDLLKISWPTVVYSLLETAVGLVDIYFSGFLGHPAVAALGFSRQIFLVLMIGTIAVTTGTITLVSQNFGAKRYDVASSVAWHSLLVSIVAGIGLGIIGALTARICLLSLGAEPVVLAHAVPYLRVLLGGVVFLMINFSTNAVFRAMGDTKTPLKIALLVNVLNVGFNYVFLFGFPPVIPAFGVTGIAIGTVLARAIGGVLAIWMLMQTSRPVHLKMSPIIDPAMLRHILHIGVPTGVSGFFRNGARVLFIGIIASTAAGTTAVAAASIGFQIRMLSIMPALAFQVGTAALVGQSIGAKNAEKAEAYGWTAIQFVSMIMAVTSIILIIWPVTIVGLFTTDKDVLALARITLICIAFEQFCNCVSIVAGGALAGSGDTRPSMRYTVFAQWMLMIPAAWFFVAYSPWDVYGAWVAWGVAPAVQSVLTVMRFWRGKWKAVRVVYHPEDAGDVEPA